MSVAAPVSSTDKSLPAPEASAPAASARLPLVSFGAVVLYWTATFTVRALEIPFFFRFLFGMAAPFLLFLFFNGWWWSRRRIPLLDRALGYALVVGGAFVAAPLSHPSLGVATAFMGWLPIMMSVWILWTFLAQRLQVSRPRIPSILIAGAVWGSLLLLRNEGMDGDLRADFHWRWSKTAEEQFLASHTSGNAKQPGPAAESKTPRANAKMQAGDGDWTGFRGPNRDSKVHGTSIDTDWKQNPPKLLWKHRIGPAWSSMCVIGDRLFTQEQRGEQEAVVCYNAATGEEIWVHEDTARFYEAVSAAGPRATPTFAAGRIYTLGATGILNCLDAGSGNVIWRHDLKVESHAEVPIWGMSTSPLLTDGLVIVYGGGENRPNLLAFDAESGKPTWAADAGATTYASPHGATLDGKRQVLILSDAGLISVDPEGIRLWQGGAAMPGAPRNLQPNIVDETHLVQGTFDMGSTTLVAVSQNGAAWEAAADWSSPGMKPEFSDLIVHKGHAYGFDGAIFCCVELETGKRTWKGGRYGRGQALLLADQDLLLVLSEKGEAILVAANPDLHQELGRIQAITGKTWNHPALAHGRLFLRNAEEIACYELPSKKE